MANLRRGIIAAQLAEQLYLFNPIDLAPAVPIEVAPLVVRPVTPPAPKLKPQAQVAALAWRGDLKMLDMVVVLPFTDVNGKEHGAFLKTPGVIVGFNDCGQMVMVDVGTPGNSYHASPWRLVKMDG